MRNVMTHHWNCLTWIRSIRAANRSKSMLRRRFGSRFIVDHCLIRVHTKQNYIHRVSLLWTFIAIGRIENIVLVLCSFSQVKVAEVRLIQRFFVLVFFFSPFWRIEEERDKRRNLAENKRCFCEFQWTQEKKQKRNKSRKRKVSQRSGEDFFLN